MALSDEKLSLVTIIVTFVLCMFWLTMTDSEFARKNTQAEGEMLERSFGTGERQKFCVHGIIGARQTGASNEHEHQTQFS